MRFLWRQAQSFVQGLHVARTDLVRDIQIDGFILPVLQGLTGQLPGGVRQRHAVSQHAVSVGNHVVFLTETQPAVLGGRPGDGTVDEVTGYGNILVAKQHGGGARAQGKRCEILAVCLEGYVGALQAFDGRLNGYTLYFAVNDNQIGIRQKPGFGSLRRPLRGRLNVS